MSTGRHSQILAWPLTWWYAPMPVAGAIMIVYSVRNLIQQIDELFSFGWFKQRKRRDVIVE
jgi:TRAP-type C4-dicarboxylate transport system permease small subunit